MARGGSRLGAGRPPEHSKTVHFLRLDVRRLSKQGLLSVGNVCKLTWSPGRTYDQRSIWFRVDHHHIELMPTLDTAKGSGVLIQLTETLCNFGGSRKWFLCPECDKRMATLFLAQRVACRKCLDLRYPTQSESELDRIWRRKRRLAARLGSDGSDWQWHFKPAGMRQTTFDRIRRDLMVLEERLVEILQLGLARLTSSSSSGRLVHH